MILPILILGDKRLRTRSEQVKFTEIDANFRKLVDDMFETMYSAPGVGLAAVQVGALKRFMVLDIAYRQNEDGKLKAREPHVIINPEIINSEGEIIWEEGCLSCPELVVPMTRKKKITLKYWDLEGREQQLAGEDLLAVAFQHEIDHMDGKLIVDALSPLKRDLYVKQLKKEGKGFQGPIVR